MRSLSSLRGQKSSLTFRALGGIDVIWFSFWIAEACAAIYAAVQLRRRMKAVRRELAG